MIHLDSSLLIDLQRETARERPGPAMDALEAMETCRAMRWLKPDPVPEELIRKVLRAAIVP